MVSSVGLLLHLLAVNTGGWAEASQREQALHSCTPRLRLVCLCYDVCSNSF